MLFNLLLLVSSLTWRPTGCAIIKPWSEWICDYCAMGEGRCTAG